MHAQILGEKHWCIMGPEAYLGLDETGEFDFAALADVSSCRIPSAREESVWTRPTCNVMCTSDSPNYKRWH
jgi:hypothetical protein